MKRSIATGAIIIIIIGIPAVCEKAMGQEEWKTKLLLTELGVEQQPGGKGYLTECEKAGGKIVKIKECDGSEGDWCVISEKEQCYTDQVENGRCTVGKYSEELKGILGITPRVLCDAAESAKSLSARDQWSLCKEMWLKDKKVSEETRTWRKITIKEVSVFGGFFAKGCINNDCLFPVHIIPNLDRIDIATLRQQLKEGSVVNIIGKCDGVTENNEVIIETEEVQVYE